MADTGFSTHDARVLAERADALFEAKGERERLFDALVAITGTYHDEGHWGRMDEGCGGPRRTPARWGTSGGSATL